MKKIIYTLFVLPFFMLGISCDDFLTEELRYEREFLEDRTGCRIGNLWTTQVISHHIRLDQLRVPGSGISF